MRWNRAKRNGQVKDAAAIPHDAAETLSMMNGTQGEQRGGAKG